MSHPGGLNARPGRHHRGGPRLHQDEPPRRAGASRQGSRLPVWLLYAWHRHVYVHAATEPPPAHHDSAGRILHRFVFPTPKPTVSQKDISFLFFLSKTADQLID